MRTISKSVFEFSELSDSAKKNARECYQRAGDGDNYFAESVIEYAEIIGRILGIDFDIRMGSKSEPAIYFSGFGSQGDGACFTGSYSYKKGMCKALAAHAPKDEKLKRIAESLQTAQRKLFYSFTSVITTSGRYSHAHTMHFENDCERGDIANNESDIEDALRDFANWIYRQLENEYNYQNSDDAIDENIEASDYEFYENGEILQ